MVILINPNNEHELDLTIIKVHLKNLECLLTTHNISDSSEFSKWSNDFKKLYGKKQVTLHLYCVYALLYYVGYVFINRFILNNEIPFQKKGLSALKEIDINLKVKLNGLNLFEIKYFDPIFILSETENLEFFISLIWSVSKFIFELKIPPEYYFDYLIQKLISPLIRHKTGEYYTPPFLVKKMVNNSYIFGETVLDPCCGSGNFLSEIIKLVLSKKESNKDKIAAINDIYGFDINPISIYITKLNLLYLTKDYITEINFKLFNFDSLFNSEKDFTYKFDLVIGNPPWYTYRDIESVEYQEKAKLLAEKLKIKPQPKNLLNLEISTLFFYKAKTTFMKEGAKIFFVITKGVITGSHASRFRNFEGLSNIKIWTFNKKVENIFNLDFICLFGKKSSTRLANSNSEIKSYHFNVKKEIKQIEYFKNLDLDLEREDILVPYNIEIKAGNIYTKKLVSKSVLKNLLPINESYYKSLFHKGADLNPRNLIFLRCNEFKDSLLRINPEKKIFKRAKSPWDKIEFKDEIVENKYIFNVIKSTELIKFYVYNYYQVFLPLSRSDLTFEYANLDKYAKLFYDKINNLYKKYKKETTKHENLIDNLNRWSKLINKRQLSKIKVVFNNSGSILQSAVIQGDYLVTGDLSFYATENLNEAFYLSAILNSNLITNQVKIMKSSRHIFKLPLDIPIRKYKSDNPSHQKLVELGRKGQEIAKEQVNGYINFSKLKIQNILYEKLKPTLNQIDEILIKEFDQK
ncbi:MAG: class I SAM-dependent DNA methyltransferase [Candidatus Hermodarchaeota archaeon]